MNHPNTYKLRRKMFLSIKKTDKDEIRIKSKEKPIKIANEINTVTDSA